LLDTLHNATANFYGLVIADLQLFYAISRKWCKIVLTLLQNVNTKSYAIYQMVSWMTLN